MDDLLTIILIIRDRPFYTSRWMRYANKTSFPFKILIADGGKDQLVENDLKQNSNYPNLKYHYLRFPYDDCTKTYLTKISNALDQVKTPYVVLADDDDFWNIEGLRASIHFLEKNPDYTTCRGRNFVFIQNKNRMKTAFSPHSICDITQARATDRVRAVYAHHAWTFYDIHRTPQYQAIFKKVASLSFHFLPMIETMVSLMSAAQGKTKQLDIPYLIREDGHGQSTSRAQDHLSRLLGGPCAEQLKIMHQTVTEEVIKYDGIQSDDLVEKLHNDFLNFLAPSVLHHILAFYDISSSEVLRNIKTWLIYFLEKKYGGVKEKLRSIAKYLYYRKTKKSLKKHLKNHPDEKYFFQEINQFLNQYK